MRSLKEKELPLELLFPPKNRLIIALGLNSQQNLNRNHRWTSVTRGLIVGTLRSDTLPRGDAGFFRIMVS